MDPNDSRYPESKMPQGLRDFVHDPNDTRYQNPDKIIPAGNSSKFKRLENFKCFVSKIITPMIVEQSITA